MTADEFRCLALEIPGAIESSHMDHPDFRVCGKIFASLGHPDEAYGMVNLAPEQQRRFLKQAPDVFAPCAGAWGRYGATNVLLSLAKAEFLRPALEAAAYKIALKSKNKQRGARGSEAST